MVTVRQRALAWTTLSMMLLVANELRSAEQLLDLSQAVVVVSPGERGHAEMMATTILVEEVAKRTKIALPVQSTWAADGRSVIAVATRESKIPWSDRVPPAAIRFSQEVRPEGYAIYVQQQSANQPPAVFVMGTDSRGAMFGVGRLLRELHCEVGEINLDASFRVVEAPDYPARGHELGYRARANSYDAWSREQYDQYIREQIVFGMNCVQNIPFQDTRTNKLMQHSRRDMNRILGEICSR